MNAIDKAISFFSPAAGLRRARARQALGVVSRLAYEGANVGRRTAGWNASGTSANAEIGVSLSRLRDRARQLVRDNPHAAKAIAELVGSAVGTGITARPNLDNAAQAERIKTLWDEFCDHCDADEQLDFYGLQALAAKTIFVSGEVLIRRRVRLEKDGLTIPLQLQILEPDYLDHGKTESLANGGQIIQGIELDAIGRRAAYWLFDRHPGDVNPTLTRGSYQSKRVPASEILHIYEKDRPGQQRGVTRFSPVLIPLRDFDEYREAQLVAKKIAACFSVFVEQPDGADGGQIGGTGTDTAGNRLDTLEPGMIEYLRTGEKVSFGNPPTTNDNEFVAGKLAEIAAGLRITYEQLTGDLSRVNYSSYRAGHLSFRNNIEQFRWLTLIPMMLEPIWYWFLEAAIKAGQLRATLADTDATWGPPGFGSVDPVKDATATLMEVRMGTKTLPQAIAERGDNFADQLAEIQKSNAALDAAGIISDADPRQVSQTGVWQQPAANDGGNNAPAGN